MKNTLILASSSPRRQELLHEAGIPFQVHPAHIPENQNPGEVPLDFALRMAKEKATAVAMQFPDRPVLGADTIVVVDQEVLGKPHDQQDAARMLRLLSGRSHHVITAVCLIIPNAQENGNQENQVFKPEDGKTYTQSRSTQVSFRELTEDEIQQYIASGEPMDKAGAYAIQGGAAHWAHRIEGEYSNVVGLPLPLVTEMLRTNGLIA